MIRREIKDGVAKITLDSPEKLNAMGVEETLELTEILDEWRKSPDVRVLVLTGNGRSFSAGGTREFLDGLRQAQGAEREKIARDAIGLAHNIVTFPVPTIAAMHGPCFGGGASLALACDHIVASKNTKMGLIYTQLGLPGGDMITSWSLTRRVGPLKALRLLADAPTLNAEEAFESGLVDELLEDPEATNARAVELAQKWAKGPVNAISSTKLGILEAEAAEALEAHVDLQVGLALRAIEGEEFNIGIDAFLAQQRPDFSGVKRHLDLV